MNKVILMGRLVKKDTREIGKKGNEHVLTNTCIAVDKFVNGEKQSEFYNITFWDKKADFIEKYVEIGKRILIEGFLTIENFKDIEEKNHRVLKIVGTTVEFADGNSKKENKQEDLEDLEDLPF